MKMAAKNYASEMLNARTQMDLAGRNNQSLSNEDFNALRHPASNGTYMNVYTQKALNGGTNGPGLNSSGGSGGSGGTKTPTQPIADPGGVGDYTGLDYYSLLSQQLAAQRAQREAAYNRNMSRIASTYNQAAGNLRGNYDSTVERLNAARDKSMGDVRADAEKSLREAYINNMLSKKNLNQRLSAMGYNGGATESTMASMSNNYGNSRLGINETLNKNIADLEQVYGDNLAEALQSYNQAMSNLGMQRMQLENAAESALNSGSSSDLSGIGSLLSLDQSYINALAGALQKQGNYSYDPTKATNEYVAGQVQQSQNIEAANNYAKALAQAQLLESQGGATDSKLINLAGGNPQTLAQILRELGRR